VDTASDWVIANLGMVDMGYHVNMGNFINVLSKQLENISRHLYYAILFSGASAEHHNYRKKTTAYIEIENHATLFSWSTWLAAWIDERR